MNATRSTEDRSFTSCKRSAATPWKKIRRFFRIRYLRFFRGLPPNAQLAVYVWNLLGDECREAKHE